MTESSQRRLLDRAEIDPRFLGMIAALLLIWLCLDQATGGLFLSARNLYNLAVQTSVVGIMATGMTLVIVARHIDLSVGSLLGFAGMLVATLQVDRLPRDPDWLWLVAVGIGLAASAAIGAWQGWWVAYRGLPAFVVTLAGLLIFRSAAYLLTDGRTVAPLDATFARLGGGVDGAIGAAASWLLGAVAAAVVLLSRWLAARARIRHGFPPRPRAIELLHVTLWLGGIALFISVMNAHTQPRTGIARGVPIPVLVLVCVSLAMTALSRHTRFGRYVFALGGNPEAAVRAGIDTRRVTLFLFALMGLLCGIAGVVTTARLGAGTSSMGTLAELSVIAAAVIGGTRLAGGVGSVPGAILGAIVMQSLENGMVLLGVSSAIRQMGIGGILILAVWLDSLYAKRRAT